MPQRSKPNYAAQAQAVQQEQTRHNSMATASVTPADTSAAKVRSAAPNNENTVMIGIRVTAQQRDDLKRLAIDKHTTVNDIVRELVERVLSEDISLNR